MTAYSQITGLPLSQKKEIVKGLLGYDECRIALDKVYKEKATVQAALDNEKGISTTYVTENGSLSETNSILTDDNKKLKSSNTFWKIFAVVAFGVGTYMGVSI